MKLVVIEVAGDSKIHAGAQGSTAALCGVRAQLVRWSTPFETDVPFVCDECARKARVLAGG